MTFSWHLLGTDDALGPFIRLSCTSFQFVICIHDHEIIGRRADEFFNKILARAGIRSAKGDTLVD
ncbi:hypothetical protein ACFQY3_15650 [Paenibacillus farraposensis]|uniref:hypothetical protein n=1 Tax=Paenibacillus farraposensis TaxID=2807095 RepID=UPI00361E0991